MIRTSNYAETFTSWLFNGYLDSKTVSIFIVVVLSMLPCLPFAFEKEPARFET